MRLSRRPIVWAAWLLPLAAWGPARAQRPPRVARVGILSASLPPPAGARSPLHNVFVERLRELGWTESLNLQLEFRFGQGSAVGIAGAAGELAALKPDVLLGSGTPAVRALVNATRTVPIVMAGAGDPVGTGLVASLARPGGNVTGVAGLGADLASKAMQFMRELLPSMKRMGALLNAADPFTPTLQPMLQQAARSLGIELRMAPVRTPDDYAPALAAWSAARVEAAFIQPSLPQAPFIKLADAQRLPSFSFGRAFPQAGGLLSYSNSQRDTAQRVA